MKRWIVTLPCLLFSASSDAIDPSKSFEQGINVAGDILKQQEDPFWSGIFLIIIILIVAVTAIVIISVKLYAKARENKSSDTTVEIVKALAGSKNDERLDTYLSRQKVKTHEPVEERVQLLENYHSGLVVRVNELEKNLGSTNKGKDQEFQTETLSRLKILEIQLEELEHVIVSENVKKLISGQRTLVLENQSLRYIVESGQTGYMQNPQHLDEIVKNLLHLLDLYKTDPKATLGEIKKIKGL